MFHEFFLHRSNEALWVAALENAEGLPERPPFMSIPAFIHLLYSKHCHVSHSNLSRIRMNIVTALHIQNCGCPNLRKVIWPWFARFCSACLPKV